MSGSIENRRFHRVPLALEVHFRTKGSFLVSYSVNLSKGGLFLETSDLHAPGTTLTVRFAIPGLADPVETTARVMWVRRHSSEEGLPPGLGLQFDHLEDHIGQLIDRLVQDFAGVTLMALADDSGALSRLGRYLQGILTCKVLQSSSSDVIAAGFVERVDLALLDMDSVGDNGAMLVQMATSETDPAVPVIALTNDPLMKAMALREGAAIVLANPPAYEQLRSCVLEVLAKPYRLR